MGLVTPSLPCVGKAGYMAYILNNDTRHNEGTLQQACGLSPNMESVSMPVVLAPSPQASSTKDLKSTTICPSLVLGTARPLASAPSMV